MHKDIPEHLCVLHIDNPNICAIIMSRRAGDAARIFPARKGETKLTESSERTDAPAFSKGDMKKAQIFANCRPRQFDFARKNEHLFVFVTEGMNNEGRVTRAPRDVRSLGTGTGKEI